MEKLILSIPALYADHHATAVRRILSETPGVTEMHVSSAFRQIELRYDPEETDADAIRSSLAAQGYREDMPDPALLIQASQDPHRHSAAHAKAGEPSSVPAPQPSWEGRPLWPCPGLEYKTIETPED